MDCCWLFIEVVWCFLLVACWLGFGLDALLVVMLIALWAAGMLVVCFVACYWLLFDLRFLLVCLLA